MVHKNINKASKTSEEHDHYKHGEEGNPHLGEEKATINKSKNTQSKQDQKKAKTRPKEEINKNINKKPEER